MDDSYAKSYLARIYNQFATGPMTKNYKAFSFICGKYYIKNLLFESSLYSSGWKETYVKAIFTKEEFLKSNIIYLLYKN